MSSLPNVKAVFTTERGLRHQRAALAAAPDWLDITMLRQPTAAVLRTHLAEAEYLISERVGRIEADLLAAAPELKLILRLGSLTDDIDVVAARAAGVIVCYWPQEMVIRVAEHVLLQLLALGKRLREVEAIALAAESQWGQSRRTDEDTFAYNWSGRQNLDQLYRRTVGILGFGEIGAELARRLRGWGCAVRYHKRRRLSARLEADLGIQYVNQAELLAQSDYLVNLLPYFPETDQLINADFLARMKSGACLVSCGSGSVIDEAALAEAVAGGKLGGAALDTFEWEPLLADNPLLPLARAGHNVLLTPHTAAGTDNDLHPPAPDNYENLRHHHGGQDVLNRLT